MKNQEAAELKGNTVFPAVQHTYNLARNMLKKSA